MFRGAPGIEDLRLGGDLVWVGIVAIVFAGIEVAAGALVLRRSGAGRLLGIVAASIGVLGAIGSVASAELTGLVALVLNGLVLYGLIAYGRAFRREGEGYTRDGRRGAAR